MSHDPLDAEFYQAHRDDPDVWGEPEEPPQRKRRPGAGLEATITVRFSAEEAETIRRLAKEAGLTYSEIVRRAVQHYTQPRFTIQAGVVQHPFHHEQHGPPAEGQVIYSEASQALIGASSTGTSSFRK